MSESNLIEKFKMMAMNIDKDNNEDDENYAKMQDFGADVYSELKTNNYIRQNLTIVDTNKKAHSKEMVAIIGALLEVREEYNGKLNMVNIDDDTKDFSDSYFGHLVLEILE